MIPKNHLLFGEKLNEFNLRSDPDEFVLVVNEVAARLQISPHWLMAVMELETAGSFDPSITNALGYTGLIQFGAVAAKEVGTTPDELREMDAITQMTFVEKYLSKFKGTMKCMLDVFLAVFFPIAIGKIDNWVLETKYLPAGRIARWNPLFDINKDDKIQIWEIREKLNIRLPDNFKCLANIK